MCSDVCLILLSPWHQLPMNQRCLAATAPEHWYMDLNEAAETHHRKTDSFWLWQFLLFFYSIGVLYMGAICFCSAVSVDFVTQNSFYKWVSPHSKLLRSALDVESNSDWWASQLPIQPARQTPPRHRWSSHNLHEFPPQVGENNFYQLLHLVKHNPVWDSKPAWRTPAQRPSPELGGIFAARE